MAISKMCIPKYNPTAIVLTDGDPKAISLLRSNLENPNNQINTSVVQATRLLWQDTEDGSTGLTKFSEWFVDAYNTSENRYQSTIFDTIVAGDVLYKEELPKLFFATAFSLLSKNANSSLWLCHIPRHGVNQDIVIEAARNAGFAVSTIDTELQSKVAGCPNDDLNRAVTYRMYIDCTRI